MQKILYNIVKIIQNRNTVLILGTISVITIGYLLYNYQIQQETSPISIPVAKYTIDQRTIITDDMITYIDIPKAMVGKNTIRSKTGIVGFYTNYNVVIPAGSPFYSNKENPLLVEEVPSNILSTLKKGQIPFNFEVDLDTTYGNSIFPDSIVDIYMKATDSTGNVMVGKFIADVRVIAVKDENGNDVFESIFESKVPTTILFGLDKELHLLMRKASYLERQGVELFPVPRTGAFTLAEKEALLPRIATSYLRDFVLANTVMITEEDLNEVEEETPVVEETLPTENIVVE